MVFTGWAVLKPGLAQPALDPAWALKLRSIIKWARFGLRGRKPDPARPEYIFPLVEHGFAKKEIKKLKK